MHRPRRAEPLAHHDEVHRGKEREIDHRAVGRHAHDRRFAELVAEVGEHRIDDHAPVEMVGMRRDERIEARRRDGVALRVRIADDVAERLDLAHQPKRRAAVHAEHLRDAGGGLRPGDERFERLEGAADVACRPRSAGRRPARRARRAWIWSVMVETLVEISTRRNMVRPARQFIARLDFRLTLRATLCSKQVAYDATKQARPRKAAQ